MDYLLKTLNIIENVMLIVADLDPGQKPSISEDLGDLRLMKQQLEKACDGECQKESSVLNLCSVSNSVCQHHKRQWIPELEKDLCLICGELI